MIVIKYINSIKYLVFCTILLITACQSFRFNNGNTRAGSDLFGEWAWSNGIDSIWVELMRGDTLYMTNWRGGSDEDDTTIYAIGGRFDLYLDGTFITGNHNEETIGSAYFATKTQEVLVSSQPNGSQSETAYVKLTVLSRNKLKWELSERKYIGGVRAWFEKDGPKPKPISGFKLPDDIVLTRLKE